MSTIPDPEIIRSVQRTLGVTVDGIPGLETWRAVYHHLVGDEPLTTLPDAIRAIQHTLNFPAFARDGIAGPATWTAIHREVCVAAPGPDAKPEPPRAVQTNLAQPAPCDSPLIFNHWPLEADAPKFFGYPPNLTQIELPYAMQIEGKPLAHITCSMKVAASLRRIFAAILAHYGGADGMAALRADGLATYDGCYNDRSIRGSTRRSMHALGAAIDLDAEHNPLGATTGRMPRAVVEIFKAEGWRWGGDYHGRKDWMHFEACA